MKKLRIILTGARGQLGQSIQSIASKHYPEIELLLTDRESLDVKEQGALEQFLRDKPSLLPSILINCSAYTAVDKAESDEEAAYALNSFAPGYLALSCSLLDMMMIHVSTDYVFDGKATTPYLEDHPTSPTSVYGKTKEVGEENVARLLGLRGLVVRTSWLYSPYGKNFVKTMLALSESREEVSVVCDQIGSPTYAPHLANALLNIALQATDKGYFTRPLIHYSDEGACSWFDLARLAITRIGNKECLVRAISTKEYGKTPAERPQYSVLSHRYLTEAYGITPPSWMQGIEDLATDLQEINN